MSSNEEDIAPCPERRAEKWRFLHVGNQITKEFLLSIERFRYVDYSDRCCIILHRCWLLIAPYLKKEIENFNYVKSFSFYSCNEI